MKKTVLVTLITILFLLLVSQLILGRQDSSSAHRTVQWKEISFTRIKPAARQNDRKDELDTAADDTTGSSAIKVLKPEHPSSEQSNDDTPSSKP